MGKLVQGQWSEEWYACDDKGHFIRDDTMFRERVSADGSSAALYMMTAPSTWTAL